MAYPGDPSPWFSEVLRGTGSEIYLHPAAVYIRPGAEDDFYTVLEATADKIIVLAND